MSWTLEQAKIDLGIPPDDHTKDAAITRNMDAVLAAVETYCDRKFILADALEQIVGGGQTFIVHRYPIESVASVSRDMPVTGQPIMQPVSFQVVDAYRGTIYLATPGYWPGAYYTWPGSVPNPVLWCAYRGGFDPLPADLEVCMWEMFYARWAASGGTGSLVVIGGGAVAGTGEVKRLDITGVMGVTFDVGSSGTGGGSSSGNEGSNLAGMLPSWRNILDLYKSGGGFAV